MFGYSNGSHSRPRAIIASLCLAMWLGGCGPSVSPAVKPILQPAPGRIHADCTGPVDIPEKDLTVGEVAAMWGQDRANLGDCATRHQAAIRYYDGRDKALAGK
jgi:hypothetical protein